MNNGGCTYVQLAKGKRKSPAVSRMDKRGHILQTPNTLRHSSDGVRAGPGVVSDANVHARRCLGLIRVRQGKNILAFTRAFRVVERTGLSSCFTWYKTRRGPS